MSDFLWQSKKQWPMCKTIWYSNPKPHHIDTRNEARATTLHEYCMWGCAIYFLLQSQVVAGLSYKPVKTDLDGAPWFSFNDPLTAQGVLVVAWPPRGQNDTRWPRVVAPTRSWGIEPLGQWSTGETYIKSASKRKAELLYLNLQSQKCVNITFFMAVFFLAHLNMSKVLCFTFLLSLLLFGISPQYSHNY